MEISCGIVVGQGQGAALVKAIVAIPVL